MRHRIEVASENGAQVSFTPEASELIHSATDGVPRLINVLCDNALLIGYVRGATEIDRAIVGDVLRDMTCWGTQVCPEELATHGVQELERPAGTLKPVVCVQR